MESVPLLRGFLQILAGYNVVAVENGPRLVTRDLHHHAFGNPCTNHVADGGASEVVKKPPGNPCFFASGFP